MEYSSALQHMANLAIESDVDKEFGDSEPRNDSGCASQEQELGDLASTLPRALPSQSSPQQAQRIIDFAHIQSLQG